MKIAMIGHKHIPSHEGGVEVVVEELSTRMVQLGHSVTCYNRKGHYVSRNESACGSYRGITIKTVMTIDRKGLSAMTSSFFAALQASLGDYDVVHFHAEGPCAMLWIPKLFGKRCICTIHGIDHKRAKWHGFARKYILFGEKVAVRWADKIIVLSREMQRYFQETYGRATRYIPNGISRPEIGKSSLLRSKFGLEKGNYILFLGRLVPEKGIRSLISAFRQVETDKKLIIAGGASDTDAFVHELRVLAEDDDRILFTGFVDGQEREELYSNAYLYVLPSDLEGMPMSLLEAMSYGNCCLTSDIPECVEVIGNHGVTFQRGNTDDLREKLQWLCTCPTEVARYRAGAADFICRRFNWDKVVDDTLALYSGREE